MSLSFSWRYMVLGLYKDRVKRLWHVYPVPFLRLSFGADA